MKSTFHPNDPKREAGATKTPLGLIPPVAMEEQAWVHKLGADKYGAWNWRETQVLASTYINATLRHLNSWRSGEDIDPESGRSHLGHIMANAAILLDAMKYGTLDDDRPKHPLPGGCQDPEILYDRAHFNWTTDP